MSGQKVFSILAILLSTAVLASCGSDDEANNPGGTGGGVGGGGPNGGCYSISGPIPFTGTNVYMDTINLVGGNLPGIDGWYYSTGRSSEGTVTTGGGTGVGNGLVGVGVYNESTVTLQAQSIGGGGYPYYNNSRANVQGVVQLGPSILSQITGGYQNLGNGNGYYPGYPPFPGQYPGPQDYCVSGVAFNMGYYTSYPQGLQGVVYLYLDGSQQGVAVNFGLPYSY